MEYVIEAVLDLVLELGIEASKNKKVPKIIRYLLIGLIMFLFIGVIGIVLFTGVLVLFQDIIGGIILIAIGIIMLVSCIRKFMKIYIKKNKQ